MSDEIPYRPRPRGSMDTLSTLDMPTPPYGLVDPTYRPGSIRSIPVPSGDKCPSSPMRSGYRMRVGKLEIRFADRWSIWVKEAQILELDAVDRILSPEITAIIALFEDVIKPGHTILDLLWPFYVKGFPEVGVLYARYLALWTLCITVGATLYEYEGTVSQTWIEWLSEDMSWIRDSIFQDALEKAQQLGLSDAIIAAPGGLPAPTTQQRKVVQGWVGDMNKRFGEDIDKVVGGLAELNFILQLKSFEE